MQARQGIGHASVAAGRGHIQAMSAEVVDSNPYSRLMALQRMGIVKDYERIRDKTVREAPRGPLIDAKGCDSARDFYLA